jgi:hypothetical protein
MTTLDGPRVVGRACPFHCGLSTHRCCKPSFKRVRDPARPVRRLEACFLQINRAVILVMVGKTSLALLWN